MNKEIRELLKKEIKEVNQSRFKVITGVILLILDIVLVLFSLASIYTLIITLPLVYIIRKQMMEFQMKNMMYILSRCIVDDEYSDEIMNK
tara:strand:+ start:3693 stop:3962 length:270 start_codon:yes stop_codon:yes gene_type:complete